MKQENKDLLTGVLLAAGVVIMATIAISSYDSTPTVGINPDGKCEWMMVKGEKLDCPDILPVPREEVKVDFKHDMQHDKRITFK